MKNIIFSIIIILSALFIRSEQYAIALQMLIAALAAFAFNIKTKISFALAFGIVTASVMSYLWFIKTTGTGLPAMIGNIFTGLTVANLIYLTAFISGISSGLGAWYGSAIAQFRNE